MRAEPHQAALGSVRVYVVEMLEARRVFGLSRSAEPCRHSPAVPVLRKSGATVETGNDQARQKVRITKHLLRAPGSAAVRYIFAPPVATSARDGASKEKPGSRPGCSRNRKRLTDLLRGRERGRAVGKGPQIGQDVGTFLGLRNAGKGHDGAGNGLLWRVDEVVERLKCPVATLALERCRVVEAFMGGDRAADDAVKIGADLVRAALFEAVAGLALLGRSLALGRIGLGQEDRQRLGRSGGFGAAAGGSLLRAQEDRIRGQPAYAARKCLRR